MPDDDAGTEDQVHCLQKDKRGLEIIPALEPRRRRKEWTPAFCPVKAKDKLIDFSFAKEVLSEKKIRELGIQIAKHREKARQQAVDAAEQVDIAFPKL